MTSLLVLDGGCVRRVLPMRECVSAMREAMVAVSNRAVATPLRQIMPLKDGSGFLALMPGSAVTPPAFGAKLVSLMPNNPAVGRPAIQGFVALFDHETGAPRALLDGASLTALRTAAVSGLATELLSRADVRSHGVFGSGVQAVTHAQAVLAVRPGIEETLVWGRSVENAERAASEIAATTGSLARAVVAAEDAAACDVVSTVTASPEPILKGAWLRAGTHVNLVGSHMPNKREADTALIGRSAVYVDVIESALSEAGDLLMPIQEGAFSADVIRGEIGALASGRIAGRRNQEEVTVYKSLGVFAQDLFAGWRAYERALALGEGTEISL